MIHQLVSDHGVQRIVQSLKQANGTVRLVGGCVRDCMLGRPTKDIDLATDLIPEKTMEVLQLCGIKTIPTGLKHGTVTAVVRGVPYEITTLRRDVKCDGRHADVVFTDDWQEDASRRDFTFNALYCDENGTVYDYFAGIEDLKNRTVVFIGDAEQRINEDFLRILRAFRFHASICSDSVLSPQIIDLCCRYADKIATLSRERVRDEFFKLLACSNCVATLSAMKQCNVLVQVVPYSMDIGLLSEPPIQAQSPLIKLATMLKACIAENSDVEPMVENLAAGIRLTKQEKKLLRTLLTTNLPFPLSKHQQLKNLDKYGNETYRSLLIVEALRKKDAASDVLDEHIANIGTFRQFTFPISGKDLTDIGFREGKTIGDMLRSLRRVWLQDPVNTTKEKLLLIAKSNDKL